MEFTDYSNNDYSNNGNSLKFVEFVDSNPNSHFNPFVKNTDTNVSIGVVTCLAGNNENIDSTNNTNNTKVCNNNIRETEYNVDEKNKNISSMENVIDDGYSNFSIQNKNTDFNFRNAYSADSKMKTTDSLEKPSINFSEINFGDSHRRILKGYSSTNKKKSSQYRRTYVHFTMNFCYYFFLSYR